MVFQQPNPFPMSIFDNVAFALREQSRRRPRRRELEPLVVDALRRAGLYDEVRDDLDRPALRLSGGQQQRLCIARAIAPRPEVLLMDEPCSALDPISTGVIEELIGELRRDLAVVIVTHNLAQAHSVADKVAFMYLGDLVEYGTAEDVFERPARDAHARLRARAPSDERARRPAPDGRCGLGRGLWLMSLAPVPSEHARAAQLLGAARRRPALLPVVRAALLAGAPRLPGRAPVRARSPSSAAGPPGAAAGRPTRPTPNPAPDRLAAPLRTVCSACCRCCCWRWSSVCWSATG